MVLFVSTSISSTEKSCYQMKVQKSPIHDRPYFEREMIKMVLPDSKNIRRRKINKLIKQ
jgi:hypothetical protein